MIGSALNFYLIILIVLKINYYINVIDEIEKVRSKNNVNWMDVLRLAFKNAPNESKELIVNPLLCDVATATPVAKEPNAFFRIFSSKLTVI